MPQTPLVERLFPSTYHRGHPILVWIGILATFSAVFIKLWTPISVNRWPEAIAALLFIGVMFTKWKTLKNQPLIWFLFLMALIPPLLLGIRYLQDPDLAQEYASGDKMARLMLFLPFAWWLGGTARTVMWFLAVAFSGFLIAVVTNPEFLPSIEKILRGERVDFGILNWQHVAMYSGVSLLAFSCFALRVLKIKQLGTRVMGLTLVVTGTVLSIAGVITTQTRAIWLALALCIAVVLVALFVLALRKPDYRKNALAACVLVLVAGSLAGLYLSDNIVNRIRQESNVIAPLLSGDLENIPSNNMGVRIETWIIASQWIKEKPIIGWGGDVRHTAIDSADNTSDYVKCCIRHFHNTYIEFTIAFGLVGLSLVLSLYLWINWHGYQIWKQRELPTDLLSFTLLVTIFFGFINLFESYIFFWSGVFITSVAYAPAATYILSYHQNPTNKNTDVY